jgi:hypothetical protein
MVRRISWILYQTAKIGLINTESNPRCELCHVHMEPKKQVSETHQSLYSWVGKVIFPKRIESQSPRAKHPTGRLGGIRTMTARSTHVTDPPGTTRLGHPTITANIPIEGEPKSNITFPGATTPGLGVGNSSSPELVVANTPPAADGISGFAKTSRDASWL